MNKWLKEKLKRETDEKASVFTPVYLDRITIKCPECDKGGMWAVPEGFKIAIAGRLLVTCENGHRWSISGVYERKEDDNR